jgi:hypothetical protein
MFFRVTATAVVAWGVAEAGQLASNSVPPSGSVAGGSDCPAGQVIFSDSFDAGASTLWGNERGAWFASNGVYDASMPTNNPLTFTSLPYVLTDLCVQMDIRAVSDGGVWLHADSGGNDGVLLVTGGFDRTGRGLYWHIVRNGQWGAVLGEADDLFNQGDDIHLRVTVEGTVYRAYLNHSTVPASTITTDAFPSGRVGLYDYTSPAQAFDNVVLSRPCAPDADRDADSDLDDYVGFPNCMDGPTIPVDPNCLVYDLDRDGDVDLFDYSLLQTGFGCTWPGGLVNDSCGSAIAVGDGTRSYSNSGATTDGPEDPACNFGFADRGQVGADMWYCYTASCTGTAAASLCGSDYDTKLAVYAGCDCPTAAPLDCSDDDCGTGVGNVQSRVTFAATAGQSYLVRVGGYLGEQGDGKLTIGCNVDACANGSGDCFVASPTEGAGCGDATCCGKTCDLDRFCCDVTWDATCAGEAEGVCDGSFRACGPGSGVCGTPDNTPGCDSASCCNKVCLVDPFCCLDSWDATCVDEANSMCFLTCGIGAGGCHAAHTTPGCNADACCQAVCTEDPFCCDTNWDQTCVDDAAALCP